MSVNDVPLSSLPGFDTVSEIIGAHPTHHFNRVVSFHFQEKEDLIGERWHDVDLILSDDQSPFKAIGFRFERVADIQFSGFSHIMRLHIENIKDRSLEMLFYEVGDYEDGRIHLYCEEVTLFRPLSGENSY